MQLLLIKYDDECGIMKKYEYPGLLAESGRNNEGVFAGSPSYKDCPPPQPAADMFSINRHYCEIAQVHQKAFKESGRIEGGECQNQPI